MEINDIHALIDKITRKEINGWFSPGHKDAALHQASLWAFNQRYKSYAVNQEAQDDLAPFKRIYQLLPENTTGGLVSLPESYMHFLGGYVQSFDNDRDSITYTSFDIVNDDELPIRLSSQLIPITETSRIGQWVGKGKIQLWPKTPASGFTTYLKTPDAPHYSYSVLGREIVYNAGDSTQLEWDENNIMNVVIPRALSILGVAIESDNIVKYMESFKA